MGESNLQNIVPLQNPARKRTNPLAEVPAEELAKLGTPEAEAEFTRRWEHQRFGVDESE